jgi:hypothetical protein
MAPPTAKCELALTTAPTAAPAWIDVTARLRAFDLTRGRGAELDDAAPGNATVVLDNADRALDPSHTTGPYYGNLKRRRRLRLSGVLDGAAEPLFDGFVRGFPLRRSGPQDQWAEVAADDALAVLGGMEVTASLPEQRTDERIAAVLALAPWQTGAAWVLGDPALSVLGSTTVLGPVGDRALDAGLSVVAAAELQDANAAAHLRDVAKTELGAVFASKAGAIIFHSRTRRLLAGGSAPLATFGEAWAAGEIPYPEGLEPDYDDRLLYNDVKVQVQGGGTYAAGDAASQGDHFKKTLRWGVLLTQDVAGAGAASSFANYLLRRYKEPPVRIGRLPLDPYDPGGLVWPHLLGRELGDVVTVRYRPAGGGALVEQKSHVEGISVSWRAEGNVWGGEWTLSPADPTVYWILGVSALGTNTTLAV